MTSENLRGRVLPLACSAGCLAALLMLASGCGTSAYSEQFEKRLVELQKVSAFAALAKPTDHLPVNLRAPLSMVDPAHVFNLYSANPADASKYVDRDRALPPFMLDGVGYRMTFEGKHTLNVSNSAPYFLYVWQFDAAKSKDGLIALRNLLREKLQDPKADWESVDVKTPEGKTLTWKRLHLKGQQQFDLFHNNNTEPEAASGVFELWYFDTPGWDVLLGWRATDEAWDKAKSVDTKLSDLPEIVAGTIKFKDDETRAKKPAPPSRTWVIGPVSAAPVVPGNVPATPPNATTPNPAAPPANSAAVHIGSASEWQGHPYSFTPPTGWTRQGNDPVVTFMQAGATPGTLPEVMAISMRQQPETVPSNQLFRQTENDVAAKMQEFQMGPNGSVSVGDMKGESREVNGKENGLPRKMILYMVRKGAVMMIFQGIFNEENYKAMRPVFDEFVKSFHFDSGGASSEVVGGNVAAADPQQSPEIEAVARRFMIATITKDEAELRATAVANPELETLWKGLKPPPPEIVEQIKRELESVVFKRLKPGDEVLLPGGQKVMIDETQVNENRQQLSSNGQPVPIILVKERDGWKVEPGPLIAAVKAALALAPATGRPDAAPQQQAFALVPENERYHSNTLRCSIRLPTEWAVKGETATRFTAAYAGSSESPVLKGLNLSVDEIPIAKGSRQTAKEFVELSASRGGTTFVEQGDIEIGGQPGAYFVRALPQSDLLEPNFLVRNGDRFISVRYRVGKDGYDVVKEIMKQSVSTLQFDADAAAPQSTRPNGRGRPMPVVDPNKPDGAAPPVANAPAAGPAAPPEKQGPVQIEFQDKVSASIEFPAGFQHNGKAPEASTVPPMTNEPGAVATPPDTIKIQVAKLGPGVNYNDLRRDSINSETQGGSSNKILERGSCNIGGTSGDSLVVWVPAGNTGGNDAPRRHLVYLANNTAKRLAIKVTADIADANFKQRKEEMIKCLKTLKFD